VVIAAGESGPAYRGEVPGFVVLSIGAADRLDTLAFVEQRRSYLTVRASLNGSAAEVHLRQPFSDDPLLEPTKDGSGIVVITRRVSSRNLQATFTVTCLSARGDTVFSRDFPYQPVSLSDRKFDAGLSDITRLPGLPKGMQFNPDDLATNAYRPKYLPPIRFVTVASDGNIWLFRQGDESARSTSYLVLRPSGTPLATVDVPLREKVVDAFGTRVWTVSIDSGDAPAISLYRIEQTPENRPPSPD
jgi:hypothetical protein